MKDFTLAKESNGGAKTLVFLGLGSNRTFMNKTPLELLTCACVSLYKLLKNMQVSSVYRTEAMYVKEQDDFYNMAVSGFYEGTAVELLEEVHKIESVYGRDRTKEIRNGPRPLDIDIEFFGSSSVKIDEPYENYLVLPHPRAKERAFVLKPLLELFPKYAEIKSSSIDLYGNLLNKLENQRVELCLSDKEMLSKLKAAQNVNC